MRVGIDMTFAASGCSSVVGVPGSVFLLHFPLFFVDLLHSFFGAVTEVLLLSQATTWLSILLALLTFGSHIRGLLVRGLSLHSYASGRYSMIRPFVLVDGDGVFITPMEPCVVSSFA